MVVLAVSPQNECLGRVCQATEEFPRPFLSALPLPLPLPLLLPAERPRLPFPLPASPAKETEALGVDVCEDRLDEVDFQDLTLEDRDRCDLGEAFGDLERVEDDLDLDLALALGVGVVFLHTRLKSVDN